MLKTIKYNTVDREILKALCIGVDTYELKAEERSASVKRRRAQSTSKKNSELKKLAEFGKV